MQLSAGQFTLVKWPRVLNLPITFTLKENPNNVAKIIGVGDKARLIIAPKDVNTNEKFSGLAGLKTFL